MVDKDLYIAQLSAKLRLQKEKIKRLAYENALLKLSYKNVIVLKAKEDISPSEMSDIQNKLEATIETGVLVIPEAYEIVGVTPLFDNVEIKILKEGEDPCSSR